MILLAFLLPLSFYLLVLGIINRRPHPLMVSGPWDFTGILFAASGFILFGGLFVLSTLNENARVFFMLGPHSGGLGEGEILWAVWVVSSVLYFVLVVAGAAGMLWLRRKHTVIYNIDLASFEEALAAVCARLSLDPARSGTSYLFDSAKSPLPAGLEKTGEGIATETRLPRQLAAPFEPQRVLVEVDYFPAMRHITLSWSSPNTVVRKQVETELTNQLNEIVVAPSELGGWLTVLAFALLGASCLVGFGVLVYRFVSRL